MSSILLPLNVLARAENISEAFRQHISVHLHHGWKQAGSIHAIPAPEAQQEPDVSSGGGPGQHSSTASEAEQVLLHCLTLQG